MNTTDQFYNSIVMPLGELILDMELNTECSWLPQGIEFKDVSAFSLVSIFTGAYCELLTEGFNGVAYVSYRDNGNAIVALRDLFYAVNFSTECCDDDCVFLTVCKKTNWTDCETFLRTATFGRDLSGRKRKCEY